MYPLKIFVKYMHIHLVLIVHITFQILFHKMFSLSRVSGCRRAAKGLQRPAARRKTGIFRRRVGSDPLPGVFHGVCFFFRYCLRCIRNTGI